MSRLKLRHESITICPYADKHGCNHPRCLRMYGQECYIKNAFRKGKKHGKGKVTKNRFNGHKHKNVN